MTTVRVPDRAQPHPAARLARAAALCGALVALAACMTVGPDFAAPVPQGPARWDAWHSGAAALAASPEAMSRERKGWSSFGDPVLTALIARARLANADLQTAALRFAQSRVQEAAVEAQAGAQASARAGATRQRQSERGSGTRLVDAIGSGGGAPGRDRLIGVLSEPFSLYQAGFDASWEIDLWGRVRRLVEEAQAGSDLAQATLGQTQLSITAEVAREYFQLRSAQRQGQLVQADLARAEEALELTRAQFQGGLADDTAVIGQQAQLAQLRAQLPMLLAKEAQAASRLSLLCGARPGALQAELAWSDAQPALPDLSLGLPSDLARRRPDIAAAEARLHAATARIGVAMAELYPRVTLGAGIGVESLTASRLGAWGSRQWSVGPALTIPIFDRGRRKAVVTLREIEQQEAAVAYQQTVLRAWHEVDSAVSGYVAQTQRHAQLLGRVQHTQQLERLAEARRTEGLADYVPQLEAHRAALQAQRDLADSAARLAIALVAVYKALGDDGALDPPGSAAASAHLPEAARASR